MSIFSERFTEALERSDKTQQELADYLGVDRTMISHWKAGKKKSGKEATPNPEQVAKIAKFLGVSTDYLLGIEKEEWIYQLPEDLVAFIREESLSGNPALLMTFPEIKKSGISPETLKTVIKILKDTKDGTNKQ